MNASGRKAYVSGKFYPHNRLDICDLLNRIREEELYSFDFDVKDKKIIGGILPHAGYIYSGKHCIDLFEAASQLKEEIESFIILHPIHRSGPVDYASDDKAFWSTPLGNIGLDHQFIDAMQIPAISEIHKWEHSAEVIIPFLQYYNLGEKKIIPIGYCRQTPGIAGEITQKIVSAENQTGRKIFILASSDFSHFLPEDEADRRDKIALEKIMSADPENLFRVIKKHNISICGYGPIMTLLYYAGMQTEKLNVQILSKGNSGRISPGENVVNYVSIILFTNKN